MIEINHTNICYAHKDTTLLLLDYHVWMKLSKIYIFQIMHFFV